MKYRPSHIFEALFFNDLTNLSEEFPTCNLSFKDKDLRFIIEIARKKNPKKSKITEKVVLNSLKKGAFSAKQISRLTMYAYCTVFHCLQKLLKESKVTREKEKDGTYFWRLYRV